MSKKDKNKGEEEKKEIEKTEEKQPKEFSEKETKEGGNIKKILKNSLLVGAVFLVLIVFAAIGLYFYSPLDKITRPIFKNIPYPVAIVGESRSVVTSSDLIKNTDAVRKFYEGQDLSSKGFRIDFETTEGQLRLKVKEKDVFDKLVENKILEELAARKGILISDAEAQAEIDEKIREYGDKKSLELTLKSLYGWDIAEFRKNVVIYQLYLRRLFELYTSEVREQDGYKKAVEARKDIKDDKSNFSEVVKKYSEGESAESNGELGWFRYEHLVPEVADVVFFMEPGEVSDVIISSVGFHVIELQEKRTTKISSEKEGEEGGEIEIPEVKIRQVYVHGKTFLDWFFEQKKQTPVIVLMKGYTWNKESAHIEFVDRAMNKKEKSLRMNSDGDPSIKSIQ